MSEQTDKSVDLMTPAEVATAFRVDPKTVTRWAKAGKLSSIRTLGGHRRFKTDEAQALLFRDVSPRQVPAPVPENDNDLLNTGQVAGVLGRSDSTVRKLVQDGKLIAVETPKGRRYRVADVQAFLNGREAES